MHAHPRKDVYTQQGTSPVYNGWMIRGKGNGSDDWAGFRWVQFDWMTVNNNRPLGQDFTQNRTQMSTIHSCITTHMDNELAHASTQAYVL